MSVSIALLPVALTLRVVMGKENFENWVRSMEIRVPTNFRTELDLAVAVRKSGYDAEKWAGLIKTHLREENNFFFWELVDGRWEAVFSKALGQERITAIMREIESGSSRQIFTRTEIGSALEKSAQSFPTNFADGDLLETTLRDYGFSPTRGVDGVMTCNYRGTHMRFEPVEAGPYHVKIAGAHNIQDMYLLLSNLDGDYKRLVQTNTYERLLSKAEKKNLTVESEEVLEDNSIVLTLAVQE